MASRLQILFSPTLFTRKHFTSSYRLLYAYRLNAEYGRGNKRHLSLIHYPSMIDGIDCLPCLALIDEKFTTNTFS